MGSSVVPESIDVDMGSGVKENIETTISKSKKQKKRPAENPPASRKLPKRAATRSNLKEESVRLSEKDSVIITKEDRVVEDEAIAVRLTTAGIETEFPCRRLIDFTFHDSDGVPQPIEMLEVGDIFVSGLILPLEGSAAKDKASGIRCLGFGIVIDWSISGYDDGTPVVWISTSVSDYECVRSSGSYKIFYDHFYAKASACVEVYKKLSTSSGGNPDISLDELLAGVVRALSGMKCFPDPHSIRDFVVSQGEFIHKQLIGLDGTSEKSEKPFHGLDGTSGKSDKPFLELPVLASLRDESIKSRGFSQVLPCTRPGTLTIGPKDGVKSGASSPDEEIDDLKMARLLQEEENWRSMKQKKGTKSAGNYYIKINEDEIANDYPLPAFYKTSREETDEYIICDNGVDVQTFDDLPLNILHDWALYNSDARLVPLELLPMKQCDDVDVVIFGSGIMTDDDGSGYICDDDSTQTSSSGGSGGSQIEGMPVYLSAIKQWAVEFGSSVVSILIRTDMAWYRLGKPSKQYMPWYQPVLKTVRLATGIISLLKDQIRVARLSFSDVIKRVSGFSKDHPAFVSSSPDVVERYVAVHGQIILKQFSDFPDASIKKCAFLDGLMKKMEERHHTKWLVKKKKFLSRNEQNLNPRAAIGPVVSKRKAMQATTTRLINKIWSGYYSNNMPVESNGEIQNEVQEDDETEEPEENEDDDVGLEEKIEVVEKTQTPIPMTRPTKSSLAIKEVKWDDESVGKLPTGEVLYKKALIHGDNVAVGEAVLVQVEGVEQSYFLEYMFETTDGTKMFHGRILQRGCDTVLGNAANERELFLTNECVDLELDLVKEHVYLDIRSVPWGHQHRKANANAEKLERARAEERKKEGLPTEYYCKSLYWPERGAFYALPYGSMGVGSGSCQACKLRDAESAKETFEVDESITSFTYEGTRYSTDDYVYVSPYFFSAERDCEIFKGGRNVGLKPYVICQVLEISCTKQRRRCDVDSLQVKVRRFFRPDDISMDKAYSSDIRELYYSEEQDTIPVDMIEGKCEIRRKNDLPPQEGPVIFQHVFFCECLYDSSKGSIKQLPANIKLRYSVDNAATSKKNKGKGKEVEFDPKVENLNEASKENRLTTLDIFAGCGGLSEGLQQSGVSTTKWAIEYEEAAGDAFRLNHPGALVFVANCNVILRAIMQKCGDMEDCISTPEADELAAKMDKEELENLPLPGQVDFINGGPPCQGFSGMNRFNQSTWSKVQCEMILAFLSFADYYRPKYFLLENVRNFVSFNQGQTFRLTVASLLEMGYQVRFGILEAGTYGVPQSRKRAFIWAASPEEVLPDWPEPMHVFAAPELKISLSGNSYYSAAKSTSRGAPFRPLTVRDTIADLPPVTNGASKTILEYQGDPVSWFQKNMRRSMGTLIDHISKEMNELNLIRCQRIPKRPGADWRDLPEEKVKLTNGQSVDLIPWCLPNTAKRHNQWKGLFGRLDWDGNFPTSVTDPQPMGKVGMCFHPEQDRIVTVRECARSQGFPDSYKFSGTVLHKHRQIGNAVPPPLAYALGRKLKQALDAKSANSTY